MSHPLTGVVMLGLLLVAGPLSAHGVPEPTPAPGLAYVALPPELDRVLRDYERTWRAADATALAALFAQDGFVLQGNRPPLRGRAAIQAAYEGQGGASLRLRALAYSAGDTRGYIIGTYGYGDTPADMGKFTLTLRRAPGEPWLIFSDLDNPTAPPKPQRSGTP